MPTAPPPSPGDTATVELGIDQVLADLATKLGQREIVISQLTLANRALAQRVADLEARQEPPVRDDVPPG